jgi:CDP-diacylglycerol--serine O-phosphatidyltransferase
VFSGKKVGRRVPPDMVLPIFVVVVLVVALLVSYPWVVLTLGTLIYLASLPFGWLSYRDYERRDAEAAAAAAAATPASATPDPLLPSHQADDERPARLN